MLFPWPEWRRHSTLVHRANFKWDVIEHCVPYFTKITYTGQIDECQGVPAFVMTMLHKIGDHLSTFDSVVGDLVQASGSQINEVSLWSTSECRTFSIDRTNSDSDADARRFQTRGTCPDGWWT